MELNLIEKKSSNSVREYVYQTLRTNIMNLNLKPGSNITEKDIAEMLAVSRTPAREALIKLSQEDLLDIYPQKGTVVSLIDLEHVEEARFIRKNLEIAVMKCACSEFPQDVLFELQTNLNAMEFQMKQSPVNALNLFELDNTFHKLIFKGCNKMKAWALITQVGTHLNRVRFLKLLSTQSFWGGVLKQHLKIVQAIRDKDVKKGVEVLDKHLGKLDMEIEALRLQFSEYFK